MENNVKIQNKGFIYPKSMKFEYKDEVIYLDAFDTYLNKNADEIPYSCKIKIYPDELTKLISITKKLPEVIQVGLSRNGYGVLILNIPL